MRRTWNSFVWAGFALALFGAVSYIPIFVRFPGTRDFPWANILLLVSGAALLALGLRRAYGDPERYSGKVSGAILGVLTLGLLGMFFWGNFIFARQVPASTGAPQVGAAAPDFTLPDADGKLVSLATLYRENRQVLLIFYRGHW